jgi:uncharacterized membrane protein
MKSLLQFLRTTLIGGILFLVPIVVLAVVLGKALGLAHKLVEPIAVRFAVKSVLGLHPPTLFALVVIVLFCFAAGLIARTRLAQRVIAGLEGSILSNLPGYHFIKSMGEGMLGAQTTMEYETVLVRAGEGWEIAFVIERLENGLVAIFVPGAPNPHSGSVHFVAPKQIKTTGISRMAAMKCLKQLGGGANTLLNKVKITNENSA